MVLHVGCSFGVKIEADITPTWGREVSCTFQIVVFVVLVVVIVIVVDSVGCPVCVVRCGVPISIIFKQANKPKRMQMNENDEKDFDPGGFC